MEVGIWRLFKRVHDSRRWKKGTWSLGLCFNFSLLWMFFCFFSPGGTPFWDGFMRRPKGELTHFAGVPLFGMVFRETNSTPTHFLGGTPVWDGFIGKPKGTPTHFLGGTPCWDGFIGKPKGTLTHFWGVPLFGMVYRETKRHTHSLCGGTPFWDRFIGTPEGTPAHFWGLPRFGIVFRETKRNTHTTKYMVGCGKVGINP